MCLGINLNFDLLHRMKNKQFMNAESIYSHIFVVILTATGMDQRMMGNTAWRMILQL